LVPDLPAQPVFYYDLGNPWCYLAAEQVNSRLPVVPEWEPVVGSDVAPAEPDVNRAHVERLADELGLQPLRWPPDPAPEIRRAMLVATYAKRLGKAVAYSLAAFRQAFAAGRDLGDEQTVLIAAAAAEMHPVAVLKGIGLRSVIDALAAAGERASVAGVASLPAIQIGEMVLEGEDVVEQAVRMLHVSR
jgi:2-hydroxychromene-2-carboxylate isomerase